jgi:hypothetical protein
MGIEVHHFKRGLQLALLNALSPVKKDFVVLFYNQSWYWLVAPQATTRFQKYPYCIGRPGTKLGVDRSSEAGPKAYRIEKEI